MPSVQTTSTALLTTSVVQQRIGNNVNSN